MGSVKKKVIGVPTDEEVAEALMAAHANISGAARALGIARGRLEGMITRSDELKKSLKEASETKKDTIESALMKKILEGDTTAIIFAAKTQLRDRGYAQSVPLSSEGGGHRVATIDRIFSWLSWRKASGGDNNFVWGTTRSGKTYAILQWLVDQVDCGGIAGQVLVAGQTSPFLRNGAGQYLRKIAAEYSEFEILNNGLTLRHRNGSQIVCQSFEDESRALSAQWAAVFLNEGNYISRPVFEALRVRCNGIMICDFNPSLSEWWGSERQTEDNSLFCTFADNRFLNDTQRRAIEDIRVRGEYAPVGSYANWYYQVYYLGRYAEMGGGVFTNIRRGDAEEMTRCESVEAWGIDFGDVADPNALVRVKLDSAASRLFVECKLYRTGVDDVELTELLNELGVERLVFETATGGQTRAKNFKRLGFKGWVVPCEKERVAAGVFNLAQYEIICCDDYSFSEFRDYRIEGGMFRGADHCIDATRYVAQKLITGQIKKKK